MKDEAITNFLLLGGPSTRREFQKINRIAPSFDKRGSVEKFRVQILASKPSFPWTCCAKEIPLEERDHPKISAGKFLDQKKSQKEEIAE
jgi:hypothetical protein